MMHRIGKGVTAPRGSRGSVITSYLLAALAILAAIPFAGCGGEKPSEVELKALAPYAGNWEGEDGTTLSIRADGTGNFESDGASVTGGRAIVDEAKKTLKISGLLGISGTWKIDEPPHATPGGGTEMRLDSMIYRRVTGFGAGATNAAIGSVPAAAELQPIVTATLLDLNNAITSGNFSPFYATISRTWQAQTTPEQLREAFQDFSSKKVDFRGIAGHEPVFEPAPALDENNLLVANGYYQVGPNHLDFALKYIWEDSQWRPFATNVNFRIEGK